MKWRSNRVVPAILTYLNGAFWLCLRGGDAAADKYPFLAVVGRAPVRLAALFAFGVTLCWTLAAFGAQRKETMSVRAGQRRGVRAASGRVSDVDAGRNLRIVGGGCSRRLRRAPRSRCEEEDRISLRPLSDGRELLMGAAMLYVMLFHTELTGAVYPPGLWEFLRFGFTGVDLFLLLSGIGMVFSLEGNSRALPFYARRARRIYPDVVPWVLAFSLINMWAGRCSLPLLIANCLGVGYWVSGSKGAFNWYLSAILAFDLLAPFVFYLLRKRRGRAARAAGMMALALLPMLAAVDLLHRGRLAMALSRLPVFLLGMLAGFWMREDVTLTRAEYRSLIPLAALLALCSLASIAEDFPVIGWLWLSGGAAMALASLPLAKALGRLREGGTPARMLRWMGANSLPLYLCNILLVRSYKLFFDEGAGSGARRTLCSLALVGINLGLVWLVRELREGLRRHSR